MKTVFFILCIALVTGLECQAQILPKEGDSLHYNQVLFKVPLTPGASNYHFTVVKDGSKDMIISEQAENRAVIISGLEFGASYTWNVTATNTKGEILKEYDPAHFVIRFTKWSDTRRYRYRVNGASDEEDLLLFDYGRIAVNRKGEAVWTMPNFDFVDSLQLLRDLNQTESGTFTCILGGNPAEFDRDGKIIWKAPKQPIRPGSPNNFYHHDLEKLPNGNYMVCGSEFLDRVSPEGDTVEVEFGTLIEFDKDNNIKWRWTSSTYFTDEDVFRLPKKEGEWQVRAHLNSFSAHGNRIFAGFRDADRIIEIDKRTKRVVRSYGGWGATKEPNSNTHFFRKQHASELISDGNLAVLNNDSIQLAGRVSSIIIFSQLKNSKSKIVWKFPLDFDNLTDGKAMKTGNIEEQENGNILVNAGTLNRCFEVTRNKKVVFDMFMEQYDYKQKDWIPFPQYRVHECTSLYPIAFGSTILNPESKWNQTIHYKISNIGSSSDSYIIEGYKDGRVYRRYISNTVDAGDSVVLPIATNGAKIDKIITRSVTSEEEEVNVLN